VGAGNVKLVYARWYQLPDLPFRVLVYMALRSMDTDKPPLYWGGWEELALAAGRLVPDRDDDDKEVIRVRRAAAKSVDSVTSTLVARGAIRVRKGAAPGRNARYELTLVDGALHAQRAPSDPSMSVDAARSADTTMHGEPTNGARSADETLHGERAPEEYEEEVRTQGEDESADLRTAVTLPAREAETDPIESPMSTQHEPPSGGRPTCGRRNCRNGIVKLGINERPCHICPQPERSPAA